MSNMTLQGQLKAKLKYQVSHDTNKTSRHRMAIAGRLPVHLAGHAIGERKRPTIEETAVPRATT